MRITSYKMCAILFIASTHIIFANIEQNLTSLAQSLQQLYKVAPKDAPKPPLAFNPADLKKGLGGLKKIASPTKPPTPSAGNLGAQAAALAAIAAKPSAAVKKSPEAEALTKLTNDLLEPAKMAFTNRYFGIGKGNDLQTFAQDIKPNSNGHIALTPTIKKTVIELINNFPTTGTLDHVKNRISCMLALIVIDPSAIPLMLQKIKDLQSKDDWSNLEHTYYIIETIYNYAIKCVEESFAHADACNDIAVALGIPLALREFVSNIQQNINPYTKTALAKDAQSKAKQFYANIETLQKTLDTFLETNKVRFNALFNTCSGTANFSIDDYKDAMLVVNRIFCVMETYRPETAPYYPVVLDIAKMAEAVTKYNNIIVQKNDAWVTLQKSTYLNAIIPTLSIFVAYIKGVGGQQPCVICFNREMCKKFGDDKLVTSEKPDAQGIVKFTLKEDSDRYIIDNFRVYLPDLRSYHEAVDNVFKNLKIIKQFIDEKAPRYTDDFLQLENTMRAAKETGCYMRKFSL